MSRSPRRAPPWIGYCMLERRPFTTRSTVPLLAMLSSGENGNGKGEKLRHSLEFSQGDFCVLLRLAPRIPSATSGLLQHVPMSVGSPSMKGTACRGTASCVSQQPSAIVLCRCWVGGASPSPDRRPEARVALGAKLHNPLKPPADFAHLYANLHSALLDTAASQAEK